LCVVLTSEIFLFLYTYCIFELLPPQKSAIRENGLLDPATLAIAIELPTSGGKTLLAEFKILQALNQFSSDFGWVAYVAPTKALVSQLTRRLRKDFAPYIQVEQLSSSVDIDDIEDDILSSKKFDVLVSTPEKMNLVIRSKKIKRPLALVVMDEAQNIEDIERGLRIELLLATIKEDCANANFLLLMPFVNNAIDLARWLASDYASSKSISIASTPWRPNEKIVGLINRRKNQNRVNELCIEVIINDKNSLNFTGNYKIKNIDKNINSKFTLDGIYPNPFNAFTTINYYCEKPGIVELFIWDIAGREVESSKILIRNSGSYNTTWDASQFPSGVYIVQLRWDGQIIGNRKLLLLK